MIKIKLVIFRCVVVMVAVGFGFSCHEQNTNDSRAVREELRSRKPIHLTQGQIEERAFDLGDTLLRKAQEQFILKLTSSGDSSCVPVFQQIADSSYARYGASLKRIPFDPARLNALSSAKEKEVLDACFYNRENNLRIDPNLQKDGDKEFIYTKALILNNGKCASCHLNSKNPLLKATLRDTIGIWSVRFTKKQVVMSFVN